MTAKEAGTKGAQGCAGSGRTSADTASAVGISARQRNRRNLTEAELLRCVRELDKRKTAGRPAADKLTQPCVNSDRHDRTSATDTAAAVGISALIGTPRTLIFSQPQKFANVLLSFLLSAGLYRAIQR